MLKRLLSFSFAILVACHAPLLPAQGAPARVEQSASQTSTSTPRALPQLAQRLPDTIPPLYMLGGDDKISPVASWSAATDPFPSTILTHSRTSNATVIDSTGKLTYAPNNLLVQSNTFSNAAWTKQFTTVASGATDRLGGTSAWTVTATSANGQIAQGVSVSTAASTNFIPSLWIKRRTGTGNIKFYNPAATVATIIAVDNTWKQFYIPGLGTGTSAYITLLIETSGDAVDISEAGLSAVTYETTPRTADQVITTSAAYYGPRIDYDPNTLSVKGLQIEESRTNVISASNDLSSAAWTKNGTTVTTNSATGPDGQTSLAQVNKTSALNGQFYRNYSTANTKTISFYASKGSLNYVAVSMYSGIGSAFFNLNTGAVAATNNGTATVAASIVAIGGGVYRCIAVFSGTYTPAELHIEPSDGTNTTQLAPWSAGGTGTINLGFVQVEEGQSFATSYIPTAAASVTRAADVVQFTGAALTALQGSAGSAIVQMTDQSVGYSAPGGVVLGGSSTYWLDLASGNMYSKSGSHFLNTANAAIAGSPYRAGVAWNASGRSLAMNGGTVATDTFGGWAAITPYLGSLSGTANFVNGYVASLAIYNSRLPDATLKAKTVVGAPYAANDNGVRFAFANDNVPTFWRLAL